MIFLLLFLFAFSRSQYFKEKDGYQLKFIPKNRTEMELAIDFSYNYIKSQAKDGKFSLDVTNQNEFDLYSGSSGIILFLLELYDFKKQKNQEYIDFAKEIGRNIIINYEKAIKPIFDISFWHKGLSGLAFSFSKLLDYLNPNKDLEYSDFQQFKEKLNEIILEKYGSERMKVNVLREGSAGVGLYLSWLYQNEKNTEKKEKIMDSLLKGSQFLLENVVNVDQKKVKWFYQGNSGWEYPNYADGTSGISYFFLRLYEVTKNEHYLNISIKGANYLVSVADLSDNGCNIFYSNREDRDPLYYFTECHGPQGTSKFFLKLYDMLNDEKWLDLAIRGGNSLLKQMPTHNWIPKEGREYFFWDNLGLCDGTIGAVEYIQNLNTHHFEKKYIDSIDSMIDYVLSRKTMEGDRINYWRQSEWRKRTPHYQNQVGVYQGVAGISMTFMHLINEKVRIKLPDYLF